jgi:hypothetical protein
MATSMPPWLDWLDWLKWDCVGAGIVGRIIGLWFRMCVSLIRRLFEFLHRRPRGLVAYRSNRNDIETPKRELTAESSSIGKLGKTTIATLLTLLVWRTVTLKAVWFAAGAGGDRILAAVLLFVSASWVISLVWICFSKSKPKKIPAAARPLRKPIYTGSSGAKAS